MSISESAWNRARLNERILASGLSGLASELRLISIVDLIVYISTERMAHIENLVTSAAELSFKEGVIKFAASARVELEWECEPRIFLDLEFVHQGLRVYFTLSLESQRAGVQINYMALEDGRAETEFGTRRLIEALEDAREVSDDGIKPEDSDALRGYSH